MNIKLLYDCNTITVGKNCSMFKSIDSTNSYSKERAHLLSDGHIVVASEQLSGRGRQGKSFYSPENGGLYMSVVIKNEKAVEDSLFTVKASLAVCRAIDRLCGTSESGGAGIKWVNDIYYGGKKLCGILCEKFNDALGNKCIVAGFGVNFKLDNASLPQELRKIVTSIFDMTKKKHEPLTLCKYICEETEKLIYNGEFSDDELLAEYKRRSVVIGKEISIITENDTHLRAVAMDICPDGSLLVRTEEGVTEKLCGGEISIKVKK